MQWKHYEIMEFTSYPLTHTVVKNGVSLFISFTVGEQTVETASPVDPEVVAEVP